MHVLFTGVTCVRYVSSTKSCQRHLDVCFSIAATYLSSCPFMQWCRRRVVKFRAKCVKNGAQNESADFFGGHFLSFFRHFRGNLGKMVLDVL